MVGCFKDGCDCDLLSLLRCRVGVLGAVGELVVSVGSVIMGLGCP
jgi:hypothetical protein